MLRTDTFSIPALCSFLVVAVCCGCRDHKLVSRAMSPTIKPGQELRVNYSAYAVGDPRRWEMVAFAPPNTSNQLWIMRVVGLPGEAVLITNGLVYINGAPQQTPAELRGLRFEPAVAHPDVATVQYPYTVPPNSYFVIGDNAAIANDSRYWGAIARERIAGRAYAKD